MPNYTIDIRIVMDLLLFNIGKFSFRANLILARVKLTEFVFCFRDMHDKCRLNRQFQFMRANYEH